MILGYQTITIIRYDTSDLGTGRLLSCTGRGRCICTGRLGNVTIYDGDTTDPVRLTSHTWIEINEDNLRSLTPFYNANTNFTVRACRMWEREYDRKFLQRECRLFERVRTYKAAHQTRRYSTTNATIRHNEPAIALIEKKKRRLSYVVRQLHTTIDNINLTNMSYRAMATILVKHVTI